jgi:hypothetical protein
MGQAGQGGVGHCRAGPGRAVGARCQAGCGRGRVGPGQAAGKRCWAGWGQRPARAAGRGAAEAERAGLGRRCTLLGGVGLGWAASARGLAGHDRGRQSRAAGARCWAG